MRISNAKKYGVAFFLTLGLMVLVSCWSPDVTQTAESSLQKAQTMAEGMTQKLITQTPQTPRFAQPIDCQLGQDCFILLYPDRDPSPNAVDFGCGRQTYDDHKGTDFAIPDEQAMARGVSVVAAAPGKVLRVRDGVVDKRIQNEADIPTGLIRAGFSAQPPTMDELWQGKFNETILPQNSPALLFWVQVYGVLTGDKMIFNLYNPQGQKVVNNENFANESSKTWIGYVGKKNNPQQPLTPGNWNAEYQLIRGDRTLVKTKKQLQLQ